MSVLYKNSSFVRYGKKRLVCRAEDEKYGTVRYEHLCSCAILYFSDTCVMQMSNQRGHA